MFKKHSKALAVILTLALVFSMCCMSAAAANFGESFAADSSMLKAGDKVSYKIYLAYPEKFEGIQIKCTYSDNMKIADELVDADDSQYGNAEKMMPNLTTGSTIVNLKPMGMNNTILASNMNVQAGNLFDEDTVLLDCAFDITADGEASFDMSITEMYNMDDTDSDMSAVTGYIETYINDELKPTEAPTEAQTDETTDAPTDETPAPTDATDATDATSAEPTDATDATTPEPTEDTTSAPTDATASEPTTDEPTETPTENTYRLTGDSDLCGSDWDPDDDNNIMKYNEETGRYEIVIENLPKNAEGYSFKFTVDGAKQIPEGADNNQKFYTYDDSTTVTIWYNAVTGMWGIESDSENVETEFVDMPTAATDEPTEVPTDEPTEAPSEDVPVTDASEAPSEDSSDVPATDASETPTEAGSSSATPNTNGTKPTAPSATTPTTTNPPSSTGKVATGDSTSVAALMIVLMAAAGVVVLARKRIKD